MYFHIINIKERKNPRIKTKRQKGPKKRPRKMTFKMLDKMYNKKINRLTKRNKKYKLENETLLVRNKTLVKVLHKNDKKFQVLNSIITTKENHSEITVSTLQSANTNISKKIDQLYCIFFIMAMMWILIFMGFIKFVHSSRGLDDAALEIIQGSMVLTSILVCIVIFSTSKYFP